MELPRFIRPILVVGALSLAAIALADWVRPAPDPCCHTPQYTYMLVCRDSVVTGGSDCAVFANSGAYQGIAKAVLVAVGDSVIVVGSDSVAVRQATGMPRSGAKALLLMP